MLKPALSVFKITSWRFKSQGYSIVLSKVHLQRYLGVREKCSGVSSYTKMLSYYSLSHNYFLSTLSFSSSRTFHLHFYWHILLVIDTSEFQMFVSVCNLELLGLFLKTAKNTLSLSLMHNKAHLFSWWRLGKLQHFKVTLISDPASTSV